MTTSRAYWDALKATRDKISILMGVDISSMGSDSRTAADATMATVAALAKTLVDKGLISDTDLQTAVNAAVSSDGSIWDAEAVQPGGPGNTGASDWSTFPGEGFESGTNGADATAANTAFAAGQVGNSLLATNGTVTFDSSQHAVGSFSAKTFTQGGWTRALRTATYAATGTLYTRFYFRATGGPPASGSQVFSAQLNPDLSTPNQNGFALGLDSAGWPAMFDGAVARLAGTTPPSICNGSWWRIEAAIYGTTCECRTYTGANLTGTTASATWTGSYTSGSVNVVNIGQPYPLFGSGSSWTVWHDNVAFSTSGWVGP